MNIINTFLYKAQVTLKKEEYPIPRPSYIKNSLFLFAIAFISVKAIDTAQREVRETLRLFIPYLPGALGFTAIIFTIEQITTYGIKALGLDSPSSKSLENKTPIPKVQFQDIADISTKVEPHGNDSVTERNLSCFFFKTVYSSFEEAWSAQNPKLSNDKEQLTRIFTRSKTVVYSALTDLLTSLKNSTSTKKTEDFSSAIQDLIQARNVEITSMDQETFDFINDSPKLKERELSLNPGFQLLENDTWEADEIKTSTYPLLSESELALLVNAVDAVFKNPDTAQSLISELDSLQS